MAVNMDKRVFGNLCDPSLVVDTCQPERLEMSITHITKRSTGLLYSSDVVKWRLTQTDIQTDKQSDRWKYVSVYESDWPRWADTPRGRG